MDVAFLIPGPIAKGSCKPELPKMACGAPLPQAEPKGLTKPSPGQISALRS